MYQKWGYEYLGPVLAGYCKWLYEDLKKKEIEKVFFLSRDGDILRKAFVAMGYGKEFAVHYLCVSRKSLRAAYLYETSHYEDFIKLLPLAYSLSLKEIAGYFSLPQKECEEAATEAGLQMGEMYNTEKLLDDNRFKDWWEKIKPCVKSVSGKQHELLKGYFLQENFVGIVAIVDIGWRGNMQLYLDTMRKNMGISGWIEGYYLGLNVSARSLPQDIQAHMQGYLFFESRKYESIDVNPYIGLLELLFTNKDGSACRYETAEDGRIVPVKDENELIKEHKEQLRRIGQIQNGALHFIETNQRLVINRKNEPLKIYRKLHKRCLYPDKEMLHLFGDFHFKEDKIRPLFEKKTKLYYVRHLSQLRKDFQLATWKSGFLKNLAGFVPPYSVLFSIYYRFLQRGIR